jgi:hypothetical protein
MIKPSTKRANETRDRKRAKGLVPKHIWVYPEDWPVIKAFIDCITEKTEKKSK